MPVGEGHVLTDRITRGALSAHHRAREAERTGWVGLVGWVGWGWVGPWVLGWVRLLQGIGIMRNGVVIFRWVGRWMTFGDEGVDEAL